MPVCLSVSLILMSLPVELDSAGGRAQENHLLLSIRKELVGISNFICLNLLIHTEKGVKHIKTV